MESKRWKFDIKNFELVVFEMSLFYFGPPCNLNNFVFW